MYSVVVTFAIKAGLMPEFLPLMKANAKASLACEAGCHQFDVATDPSRPDEVLLYEVYTDCAAFDVHLSSPHFKAFDAAVGHMIAAKDVKTYVEVQQ